MDKVVLTQLQREKLKRERRIKDKQLRDNKTIKK